MRISDWSSDVCSSDLIGAEDIMGTRNLTCVVVDGAYKVAQYGQWDGYPSGQGATARAFLREQLDRATFLTRLAETFEPTRSEERRVGRGCVSTCRYRGAPDT